MLLDLADLVAKYQMKVTGVLHAGAHLAEEAPLYARLFPNAPVLWVEANPSVLSKIFDVIRPYPNQIVWEGLLWSEDGIDLPFNVTNYDGMSSSVLEFGTHPEFSPDTVFVDRITRTSITIDSIIEMQEAVSGPWGSVDTKAMNLLNMDLQGVELQCLLGAEKFLDQVDYINSEVNTEDVYVGCTKIGELDHHLSQWGFERVETSIVPGQGWGDALWVRNR